VNDDTLAVDAIKEVGPGGHFFGSPHTMARYETAFLRTLGQRLAQFRDLAPGRRGRGRATCQCDLGSSCWRNTRAADRPGDDEALKEYVAKRKAEGGVPGY